MLVGMVGAAFLSARDANAADPIFAPNLAAIDGLNGKAEVFGGSFANRSIAATQGSVSIPLAGFYGAQIDGGLGRFDHRSFAHVGGHLFWRDPTEGLFGAYASYTRWNQFGGVYVGNVAAEGERYFGRWTLQGIVGVEFGNSASNTVTTTSVVPPAGPGGPAGVVTTGTFIETFDVKTRFFDQINLKYYLTDDWDVFAGHRYQGGKHALALGTEVAVPFPGRTMATAFAEGRVGQGEFHGIWGGLRFYFGQKSKPLVARHRQDDPNNWGASNLFSIINNNSNSSTSSSTLFCNSGDTLNGDGTCGGETF